MLRTLSWQAPDTLARAQLAVFHGHVDQIRLTEDDRRRVLNLDDQAWTAWSDFLADGPLPSDPPLPEMLRRLGETAFTLSTLAERRAT